MVVTLCCIVPQRPPRHPTPVKVVVGAKVLITKLVPANARVVVGASAVLVDVYPASRLESIANAVESKENPKNRIKELREEEKKKVHEKHFILCRNSESISYSHQRHIGLL